MRGRPPENRTMPKTYSFFKVDIEKMLANGWTPKEVFRLGVLAKENQPQILERMREVEASNDVLQKKFQKIARENIDLKRKISTVEAVQASKQFEEQ